MLRYQRRLYRHGLRISTCVCASALAANQSSEQTGFLLPAGVVAISMALIGMNLSDCDNKPLPKAPGIQAGMPIITRAEVAKHKTLETGIWTTYQNGVYNITEFVANHPGGSGGLKLKLFIFSVVKFECREGAACCRWETGAILESLQAALQLTCTNGTPFSNVHRDSRPQGFGR